VAEAHEIEEKASERARYVLTDYHKRHDRAVRAARYRFRRGDLGEMLHGHAWIEEPKYMPLEKFKRWAAESSPFEYIGVHYADVYYFVTGLLPKRLVAFGQKKYLPTQGSDAFDAVQATIEWEDGSVLWIQTSWVLSDKGSAMTRQGLNLVGTLGEYWADHMNRNLHFVTEEKGFEHYNPNFFKAYDSWEAEGLVDQVGYGYESIQQALDDETAAVLVEVIQGEGGVRVADNDYLRGLRINCTQQVVLRMAPPMIVTAEQVDRGMAILDEALAAAGAAPATA
jgi:predicted dehydrogenase